MDSFSFTLSPEYLSTVMNLIILKEKINTFVYFRQAEINK